MDREKDWITYHISPFLLYLKFAKIKCESQWCVSSPFIWKLTYFCLIQRNFVGICRNFIIILTRKTCFPLLWVIFMHEFSHLSLLIMRPLCYDESNDKLIDGWYKIGWLEAVTIMMDVILTHHETKETNIMDKHWQQIQIISMFIFLWPQKPYSFLLLIDNKETRVTMLGQDHRY